MPQPIADVDMTTLSEGELGYLAGILDGDGCIALYKYGGNARAVVTIVNTDPVVIDWILSRVGGRKANSVTKYKGKECHLHHWQIGSLFAIRKFLRAIMKHMIIKRKQALTMLDYIDQKISLDTGIKTLREMKKR